MHIDTNTTIADTDSNCEMASLCCNGITYESKCDAMDAGITGCHPEKGACDGSCCDGVCVEGSCSGAASSYFGIFSYWNNGDATVMTQSQWNMGIICVQLVIFSFCFLCLGVVIGQIYLGDGTLIKLLVGDGQKKKARKSFEMDDI